METRTEHLEGMRNGRKWRRMRRGEERFAIGKETAALANQSDQALSTRQHRHRSEVVLKISLPRQCYSTATAMASISLSSGRPSGLVCRRNGKFVREKFGAVSPFTHIFSFIFFPLLSQT